MCIKSHYWLYYFSSMSMENMDPGCHKITLKSPADKSENSALP